MLILLCRFVGYACATETTVTTLCILELIDFYKVDCEIRQDDKLCDTVSFVDCLTLGSVVM